jgi:lysophospholipase L1-like esterase
VEILNLGYPGNNTTNVRNTLPDVLDTLLPDFVTFMVGVNDFWTVPAADPKGEPGQAGWRGRLWRHSRAFRLLYMIRRSFSRQDLELSFANDDVTAKLGEKEVSLGPQISSGRNPGWARRLRTNLAAILETVKSSGSQPIVVTYRANWHNYAWANQALREIAAQTQTPLIDLGAYFQTFCPGEQCAGLFFEDNHPTSAGHARAAEEMRRQMVGMRILAAAPATPRPVTPGVD